MLKLKRIPIYVLLTIVAIASSCSTAKRTVTAPVKGNEIINSLKLLGQYVVPDNMKFQNTTVGGLSGIDYDATNDIYYLLSDDRSDSGAARFYTAKISITEQGINSLRFKTVHSLLQPNGQVYPNRNQDPLHTPDPEAIRYNPAGKKLIWSSEGERTLTENKKVIQDPSINIISTKGKWISEIKIPENLRMQAIEKGPRKNGVLEGMSFADNYNTLFVNVEEPLYEDGPRVDVTENDTYIRILKFDVANNQNTAQFAYKPDPVAYSPNPLTGFKINGIPDILSVGKDKLLVIERSFSEGRSGCTVKLFLTDLAEATNIKGNASLQANKNFKAAPKKLLLNMDSLGIYIDNVEGVTFGPTLSNGHKTLVLIADNNFASAQKSQIFLFQIN